MRRPSLPTPALRPLLAVALGATLLTGCAAGQLAQTRVENTVIDGVNGAAGDVAIRYAYIPSPGDLEGYAEGSDVTLSATFINRADEPATLQQVTSDAAEEVVILSGGAGGASASPSPSMEGKPVAVSPSPSGSATVLVPAEAATASPEASTSPSADAGMGSLEIPPRLDTQLSDGTDYTLQLRGLTRPLRAAELVAVTFRFNSGSADLQVPVQTLRYVPEEQEPTRPPPE